MATKIKTSGVNVVKWGESYAPKTFYVQETIGGWRQNAAFVGTYEECAAWLEGQHGGSWAIVPEEEYEVDYLD